jgi:hypothetical protein
MTHKRVKRQASVKGGHRPDNYDESKHELDTPEAFEQGYNQFDDYQAKSYDNYDFEKGKQKVIDKFVKKDNFNEKAIISICDSFRVATEYKYITSDEMVDYLIDFFGNNEYSEQAEVYAMDTTKDAFRRFDLEYDSKKDGLTLYEWVSYFAEDE